MSSHLLSESVLHIVRLGRLNDAVEDDGLSAPKARKSYGAEFMPSLEEDAPKMLRSVVEWSWQELEVTADTSTDGYVR